MSRLLAGLAVTALTTGVLSVVAVPAPAVHADEPGSAPTVQSGSLDVVGWDDALVGTARPRLSWVVEDADRDESQSAYQVEVRGPGDSVTWDSGEVTSTASTLRPYEGPDLTSGTAYTWRVKVWDAGGLASAWSDPSPLRTGLLDLAGWDADWVAVPSRQQARTEFTVDEPVQRAVLYVAAQGNALARVNGRAVSDEELGTTWTDWDRRVLYRGVDVTELLVDGDNALGVTVAATHTNPVPSINVMAQLEVIDADGDRTVVAATGDGWRSALGGLTRVDAYRGERYDATLATTGWDTPGFDDAAWTPVPVVAAVTGAPNLSSGATVSALDTVDCCGWGRTSINDGVLVSTDSSQGYHSATAATPDATKWVQLDLGSSRPIGSVTLWPAMPTNDPAGSFPGTGFPVRYRVEVSDDPSFSSPVVLVDRTGADQPNPGTASVTIPSTATGRYVRVTATKLPASSGSFSLRLAELVVRGTEVERGWGLSALEPDSTPPMRAVDTIEPVAVDTVAPGVQRYDFGTNYAGWARLTATAPAGTTAQVYLGEILDGNGRVTTDNQNFAAGEEQRQTYRYTFAGGGQPETWEPSFVYSGFRYAEVSGLPAGTTVTLQARPVYTDLQRESTLDTGNPVLAGIEAAARQGQLIAMHGVPEDTPTREKKGWLGDAISTAGPIMDTFDADDMYRKYLGDIQTSIFEVDGGVPSVAPSRQAGREYKVDPAWAAGYPVILWSHYQREGDATLLAQHYDDLGGYVDYLDTIDDADRIVVDPEVSYGQDWQAVESTNPQMFHTLYYLRTVEILADIARVLGHDADAATYDALAGEITAGFNRRFLDEAAASYGGTQLANAFPLLAGVVPAALEDRVLDRLVANVRDRGDHLTGGFVGTRLIIQALHAFGRDDVVLDTAVRTDYPSLGFMVARGPGTIWEKWVESSAPDGTSSRSHPALAGGMQEWFYDGLAGITSLAPGYRRIGLRVPELGASTPSSASASIQSPQGRVSSHWTRTGSDLTYAVEVPVGSTAEVTVPAASRYAVTEGGSLLDEVVGVRDVAFADGNVTITVGSGRYEFSVTETGEGLGALLERIDALSTQVADLRAVGDLTSSDATALSDRLTATHDDVAAALRSLVDGDRATSADRLDDALASVRDLRAWLAASSVDGPVRGSLDRSLAALQSALERAVTAAIDIVVTLPPVVAPVLPGTTLTGTVEVTNGGTTPLEGLAGTVSVAGWGEVGVSAATVAPGASAQLPASFTVPRRAAPGSRTAVLDLTYAVDGRERSVTETTTDWVTVTSGVTLGDPTVTRPAGDPAERVLLDVPVTNAGSVELRAHVAATGAEGGVPSPEVVVPAGGTATAQVSVVVPLSRVAGPTPVTLVARRAGVELARRTTSVSLDLTTPPTGASDHVDFGDGPSETTHGLQASSRSGSGSEAGLTRRYTTTTPGEWFSAEVAVPAGQPFLLRVIDTFDAPRAKRYDVLVDGVLVREVRFSRTAAGIGTETHDILVDDPAVLDHDGTVRVRYEYPASAVGSFDASLADLWVLPLPADAQAPDVGAEVTSGEAGDNGWFRSAATVSVAAADARRPAPIVDVGVGASGWGPYVAPVTVSGEGRRTVDYRATDAAGNRVTGALEVAVDTVAPTTALGLTTGRGDQADSATLRLSAADATSGVAATLYRVDEGPWRTAGTDPVVVEGFGDHVVDYASTDVAGNPEPVRRATVSLADVETVTALLAPQLAGTARVGATLRATAGTWNTTGLGYAYQWLRDGTPVAGATRASYRLAAADVGRRVSVRVTATKAGAEPGVATSTATAPVARALSSTRVGVSRTAVRRGKPVRVTAVVASSPKATGRVRVRVDGSTVRTVSLTNGRASVAIRITKRGRHQVTVRYLGSATVAPSTSAARTVSVT